MQYCHICRGAGNLRLKLKEFKQEAVFVCYKCDGEGYITYPYEIENKDCKQSEEYIYRLDSWCDYMD